MGDMADDAWESGFEQDADERNAILAMRRKCQNAGRRCRQDCEYNDEGLIECLTCGRKTDI